MSGKINVQASSPVTETTYLVFISTSPSGQFLNSSGNPQTSSVYISTGDSNRSLYYKDSTAGDFIITAVVQNKAKTSTLATISQHIYIGQNGSTNNASSTVSNSSTATSTTTTDNVSTLSVETLSNTMSAHSSPALLSQTEEKLDFEISAGRDRLTEVGSNVLFRAVPTKFDKIPEQGIVYQWSFGDGTTGQSNNINHTYKFAGEYSVVVNAGYSDKQAVSRMTVKVVWPDISLAKISGGLQISNNSKTEINLEGWSLSGVAKAFIFPKDTLIPSGKKVIFADEITGISDASIKILNPMAKEFASIIVEKSSTTKPEIKIETLATSTMVNLDDIQAKINDVKNKLAKISSTSQSQELNKILQNNVATSSPRVPLGERKVPTTNMGLNTATVFQALAQKSFVSSIFSWPIRGFNFIKHLFIED